MAGSLEAAVIDDEIIGLIKHIVSGYEVSPETLAFDVMQEVIPAGGVFLSETHTVREMRRGAIWVPNLGDAPASRTEQIRRVWLAAPAPGSTKSWLDTRWRHCPTTSSATWTKSSRRPTAS